MTLVLGTFAGCGSKRTEEDVKNAEETSVQPEDIYIPVEEIPVPEAASDPIEKESVELSEEPSEEGKEPEKELDDQEKAYTKEEMDQLVPDYGTYFAVKRGDSFYLIGTSGTSRSENYISSSLNPILWLEDGTEPLVIDYENGDEIVAFSKGTTEGLCVHPIKSISERYCLPTFFYQNGDEAIEALSAGSEMDASYVSGNRDLNIFEKYSGTLVAQEIDDEYADYGMSAPYFYLEGDKDEIIELEGYQGTNYSTVQYRCTARHFELESYLGINIMSGDFGRTREGYAIVSNSEVNTLESGPYLLEELVLLEVK